MQSVDYCPSIMPIERLLDAPCLGQPTPVAPHIQWIRLPLPFALDHINVWLIEEEDQYTLVDTGVYQPNVIDLWRTLGAELFVNKPLGRIIITHAHPDHIGMAAQLSEVYQARVWISCGEYFAARALSADLPGVDAAAFACFLASHGLAQEPKAQETQRARGGLFAKLVPEMPLQYRRIQHGDTLQIGPHTWHCMAGFGHSPEHISLICEPLGLMISGDMLLPNISTNISVYATEPDGDPLRLFLQSLRDMLTLPNHLTVLPSHGVPFKGIHERCEQLLRHHEHRLNDLLEAIQNTPMNARQAIATLFRREMDGHQMSFAMGEAIAHLNHLWYQGKIQRIQEQGIWMFHARAITP